jgi:hypothetical protein
LKKLKILVKPAILLLLALAVCLSLVACSGGNTLVGKWSDDDDETAVMEFFKDGTYLYSWEVYRVDLGFTGTYLEFTGTYKVEGNKITITDDDDPDRKDTDDFTIAGNKLNIKGGLLEGDYTKIQ